jgi:hypothetical protein
MHPRVLEFVDVENPSLIHQAIQQNILQVQDDEQMAYEFQLDELDHNGRIDGPPLQAPIKNPQVQVNPQAQVTQGKDVLNSLDLIR